VLIWSVMTFFQRWYKLKVVKNIALFVSRKIFIERSMCSLLVRSLMGKSLYVLATNMIFSFFLWFSMNFAS